MMAAGRGMSTRAVQAERTRQQILQTAQRLFAEIGYDATSLQMIADEMGLTKAAVYYYFHAKSDILDEAMRPGVDRLAVLLDEAARIRGRHARIVHLADGFADFLVTNRAAVIASFEPTGKQKESEEPGISMRERALSLLFGAEPSAVERLSFDAVLNLPRSLPDLADLSDEELRAALRAAMLRFMRVPS
jgi:AcrR family transcriptional regulator